MRNAILLVALLAPACAALASTDCAAYVATVTVPFGAARAAPYVVVLSSGVSFTVARKSEGIGVVMMSQTMERGIIARFAADGVDCKAAVRRTDLVAIVVGREEIATMTTSPAPPTTTITVLPVPPVPATSSSPAPPR